MGIVVTDLVWRFSSTSGPGNSSTGAPADSLGGFLSQTDIDLSTTLNNLWDNVTGAESLAGDIEYRCIVLANTSTGDTAESTVVFMSTEVAGGASIALGVDDNAASTLSSTAAQCREVANENTAPSTAVAFTSPASSGAAVSMGDISPQFCRGLWLRRTTSSGSTYTANDGVTLKIITKDYGPD